jgi:predicted nucleic-acid-binding protein
MGKENMTFDVLDTNVLVRFLVGDNAVQRKQAEQWFKEGESGKRKIVVFPIVVAETSFVLESFYKKRREDIADAFEVFLSQRWLHVVERDTLLSLCQEYRKGLHFVDSFLLAWARCNGGRVLSFDKWLQG